MAMRLSWMSRMALVFVRSRAGSQTDAAWTPARNWPCTSGSTASASAIAAAVASRTAARAAFWARGAASSGARPHAVDGGEGQLRSGLPGRRADLPLVRAARAVLPLELGEAGEEGDGGLACRAPGVDRRDHRCRRRRRRSPPARRLTMRLRSQSANDGAAESTSPSPAMRSSSAPGWPIAVVTAARMPIGTVASELEKMCWANRWRKWSVEQAEEAVEQLAVAQLARDPAGRPAGRSVSRWSSTSSGSSVTPSAQPKVAPSFSVRSGRTSPGCSS